MERTNLVSEVTLTLLPRLPLTLLPRLPLTQLKELPRISAIYFALAGTGEVLYIGKAKNLFQRWQVHHRKKQLGSFEGAFLAWLEVTDTSLLEQIEKALIESFAPRLNVQRVLGEGSGMNEQIRKAAKDALEKKKISQLELAQKAGVRQATVSRFLTGERGKADTASEILGALGLELVAVPKGTDVSKLFRKGK
jgi:hypothetical protein